MHHLLMHICQTLITSITPSKQSTRYSTSYIANLTFSSISAVPVEVRRSGGRSRGGMEAEVEVAPGYHEF